MKKLLLMLLLFIPLMGFCQSEEKQYYIYNIVSFEGDFTKEDFKVYYDDGIEVKRLRNDKGEKARFSTPAGALMYFISQGWEMYLNGARLKDLQFKEPVLLKPVHIGLCGSPVQRKNLKRLLRKQKRNENDV